MGIYITSGFFEPCIARSHKHNHKSDSTILAKNLPIQNNLKPPAQSKPIDSSDDRLLAHTSTDTRKARGRMQGQVRLLLEQLGIALAEFDEILARTERLGSGAGNDGDAQTRLPVEPFEDSVQVPVDWEGD